MADTLIFGCTLQDERAYGLLATDSSLRFLSNVILDTALNSNTAVRIGVRYIGCDGSQITGNEIRDLQSVGGIRAISIYTSDDVDVQSNQITNIREGIMGTSNDSGMGIGVVTSDYARVISNRVKNCRTFAGQSDGAIFVNAASNDAQIKNNTCIDNGNQIVRGNCESATNPLLTADGVAAADKTNCGTYARSSVEEYEGTYSWIATGDGVGAMRIYFHDNTADLHGLLAALDYKLWCWVFVAAAGYTPGNVKLFYDDDVAAEIYSSVVTAAGAWELLTRKFTVDSAATILDLGLLVNETDTKSVYIDNLRVQPLGTHNRHQQQFVDNGTDTEVF